MLLSVLIHLESFSKKHTIVKFARTMGGIEIFQNCTIAKSVLIETRTMSELPVFICIRQSRVPNLHKYHVCNKVYYSKSLLLP